MPDHLNDDCAQTPHCADVGPEERLSSRLRMQGAEEAERMVAELQQKDALVASLQVALAAFQRACS